MTMNATVNASLWNILNSEPTNPELERVLARTLGVLCGEEDARDQRHWWQEFWACIERIISETAGKLRARVLQEAASQIKIRLYELVHEYQTWSYMILAQDRTPKTFCEFLRKKIREIIRYIQKVPAKVRRQLSEAVPKYNLTEHQRTIVNLVVEEHENVSTIAQRLKEGEHAIKQDLQAILRKFGVLTVLFVLCLSAALLAGHGRSIEGELRMTSAVNSQTGEAPHERYAIADTVDRIVQGGDAAVPGGDAAVPGTPPEIWSRNIPHDTIWILAESAQTPARRCIVVPGKPGSRFYEHRACSAEPQSVAEQSFSLDQPFRDCDAMALSFFDTRLRQGKVFHGSSETGRKQPLSVTSGSRSRGNTRAQAGSEDRNLSPKGNHSVAVPEQGEWLDAAKCLEREAHDAKSVISLISAYVAHGGATASELAQLRESSAQKIAAIELARNQILAFLREPKLPKNERTGISTYFKIVDGFAREAHILLKNIGFISKTGEQSKRSTRRHTERAP